MLVALLAAISVGGKLLLGVMPRDADEDANVKAAIAGFLSGHGFSIEQGDTPGTAFVWASNGSCRFALGAVAPRGWDRDAIRRLADPDDRIFYVIDGERYEYQPAWRTWLRDGWRRLNRHLGRRIANRPDLGAIASPACDVRNLHWERFPKLP